MMSKFLFKSGLVLLSWLAVSSAEAAVDSYRFAHVTIATPWYIFVFLLMGIFAPFVLMAVLSWRVAMSKSTSETQDAGNNPSVK
jgi:uncharacterized membrane protein YadS